MTLKCPFCGGDYTIALGHDELGEDEATVLHTLPACPVYMETDPLSYIALADREAGRIAEHE